MGGGLRRDLDGVRAAERIGYSHAEAAPARAAVTGKELGLLEVCSGRRLRGTKHRWWAKRKADCIRLYERTADALPFFAFFATVTYKSPPMTGPLRTALSNCLRSQAGATHPQITPTISTPSPIFASSIADFNCHHGSPSPQSTSLPPAAAF